MYIHILWVIYMRRLEIKDAEIMMMGIRNEIMRSAEARYNHRLHGLLLVCEGYSCYDVGNMLGHAPKTIENWVNHFEIKGFAGLHDEKRPGRSPRLNKSELHSVGQDLRKESRVFGYTQNFWDGKLLSYHLAHVYGIDLGVRQCQRLFHKLKFRRRKPRGIIAGGDPVAKGDFKKTH